MVSKHAISFNGWSRTDPLSQLYFSLSIILLCSPLHKLCFRVFHLVPFTFALLAFYALLMFLLRFDIVQFWCKRVFFVLFNHVLFQWYFRTCMRVENGLSSNERGSNLLWFLFSFSFTSVYLGQFLYEPYFFPVFVDALTFILIVLYIQLRGSVLFDDWPAEATPLSWSSTLAQLSRQLGFESPLQNRLLVDEVYPYMLPKLSILYMWRSVREAFIRRFRPSSVPPTAPMPPVPPEVGGAARTTYDGAFSGVIGATGAAAGSAVVTVSVHREALEQNERQHQETLVIEREKSATQQAELQQRQIEFQQRQIEFQTESKRTQIEQLTTHAKRQAEEVQQVEAQIGNLKGGKLAESQRQEYLEELRLYKARRAETEKRLHDLQTDQSAGAEGIAPAVAADITPTAVAANITPTAVYSCFEPSLLWHCC